MKKMVVLCLFVALIGLSCASTSRYQFWIWDLESIQSHQEADFQIRVVPIYDNAQVFRLELGLWNKSDEAIEIEDIILKDRYELLLRPLTPEGLAYVCLGDPPAEVPVYPRYSSSRKKFIVTGHVHEFPEGYYTGEFEIEEEERYTGGAFMRGYLRAQAQARAEYMEDFKSIVRTAKEYSFQSDVIPAHTQIEGILYYHRDVFRCPLNLEILLRASGGDFSYKYEVHPPTKKE